MPLMRYRATHIADSCLEKLKPTWKSKRNEVSTAHSFQQSENHTWKTNQRYPPFTSISINCTLNSWSKCKRWQHIAWSQIGDRSHSSFSHGQQWDSPFSQSAAEFETCSSSLKTRMSSKGIGTILTSHTTGSSWRSTKLNARCGTWGEAPPGTNPGWGLKRSAKERSHAALPELPTQLSA